MHTGRSCLFLFLFAIAIGLTSPAEAQSTYYVRAGATGSNDGSNWTNAYTALPPTLQRGATYYIADGAYRCYTFNDAESGTTRITIKKATAADHGTSTGWLDTYGDGQAIITQTIDRCWNVQTGYWTIDGNGPVGTYGFKFVATVGDPIPPPGNRILSLGVGIAAVLNNITVRSVEFDGADIKFVDAIGLNQLSGLYMSNIKVRNIEDDAVEGCHPCTNATFEYFDMDDWTNANTVESHPDAFDLYKLAGTATFRYNRIDHASQHYFFATSAQRIDIYGNVSCSSDGDVGDGGPKGVAARSTATMGPFNIFNNTWANLDIGFSLASGHTGTASNNIFYNISETLKFGGVAHTYNWYFNTPAVTEATKQTGTRNPFVNAIACADLRLTAATDAGDSGIGSAYRTDLEGVTRGADGVWDRGAYEHAGQPTEAPAPPRNLRILR